jgi:DNA-directed RNA polymerase specialized sigma24 family protein
VLYREHYGELVGMARYHSGYDNEHAEEALQQTFLYFLRDFDPESGAPPIAWFKLALKRACWARSRRETKHLKRRAPQEIGRDGGEGESVVDWIHSLDTAPEDWLIECEEARSHLGELKADERTALGSIAAGFTYRETAERHGWTYTKVNRCITEGRMALRALAELLDNENSLKNQGRGLAAPRAMNGHGMVSCKAGDASAASSTGAIRREGRARRLARGTRRLCTAILERVATSFRSWQ